MLKSLYARTLKLLAVSPLNLHTQQREYAYFTPDIRTYCDSLLTSYGYDEESGLDAMKKFVVYQVDTVRKKNCPEDEYTVAHVRYMGQIYGVKVTDTFCLSFERGQGKLGEKIARLLVSDPNGVFQFPEPINPSSEVAQEGGASTPHTSPAASLIGDRNSAPDDTAPTDSENTDILPPELEFSARHDMVSFLGRRDKQAKGDITFRQCMDFQKDDTTPINVPFTLTLFDFAIAVLTVNEMFPGYPLNSHNYYCFAAGIDALLEEVYKARVQDIPVTQKSPFGAEDSLLGRYRTSKKGTNKIGERYRTNLRQWHLAIEEANENRAKLVRPKAEAADAQPKGTNTKARIEIVSDDPVIVSGKESFSPVSIIY